MVVELKMVELDNVDFFRRSQGIRDSDAAQPNKTSDKYTTTPATVFLLLYYCHKPDFD
jgi:hypothetical protein